MKHHPPRKFRPYLLAILAFLLLLVAPFLAGRSVYKLVFNWRYAEQLDRASLTTTAMELAGFAAWLLVLTVTFLSAAVVNYVSYLNPDSEARGNRVRQLLPRPALGALFILGLAAVAASLLFVISLRPSVVLRGAEMEVTGYLSRESHDLTQVTEARIGYDRQESDMGYRVQLFDRHGQVYRGRLPSHGAALVLMSLIESQPDCPDINQLGYFQPEGRVALLNAIRHEYAAIGQNAPLECLRSMKLH